MRILVIRYRYLGDTVLAIPFLRNLRAAHPDAVIDVLVEPHAGGVLAACPYKNELIAWHRELPPPGALTPGCRGHWRAAGFLRARRYDKVYILRRAFSSVLLPFFAGIPRRIGYAVQGDGLLLTRAVPYADQHEVECFLDLLRADGVPVRDTHNENWTFPAADAGVAATFPAAAGPHVLLCPLSTNPVKNWPFARMADLLRWLVNDRGCTVHFCGTPGDFMTHEKLAAAAAPLARAPVEWSHRLDLSGALALIRRMQLTVGIDTGLLHLAASFHVPVVGLYGLQDPRRWHPWDTAHAALRAPVDDKGRPRIELLTLAAVQTAVDSLLPRGG
jgi:heptosyltransferase-2